MATHKGGKGQRGGDYRKRDVWSSQRDYNKPGSSSPGPRRSNSPHWRSQPDSANKEYRNNKDSRENHRAYATYLNDEWKKVEQDLIKDRRVLGTVEYVAKTPTDIKDEDLCNVDAHLKNREEKPASPD